jgi:hypothetical protein
MGKPPGSDIGKAVFVVDATTDEPYLRQTIQQAWSNLRPTSPNYDSVSPLLHLFNYGGPESLDPLLRTVCNGSVPEKWSPYQKRLRP